MNIRRKSHKSLMIDTLGMASPSSGASGIIRNVTVYLLDRQIYYPWNNETKSFIL